MSICEACGQENQPEATFCGRCGGFLEWSAGHPDPPEATSTLIGSPPDPEPPSERARPLVLPLTPTTAAALKTSEPSAASSPVSPPFQRRGVAITVAPRKLAVDPGGEASCDVHLRNSGSIVERYALELGGGGQVSTSSGSRTRATPSSSRPSRATTRTTTCR